MPRTISLSDTFCLGLLARPDVKAAFPGLADIARRSSAAAKSIGCGNCPAANRAAMETASKIRQFILSMGGLNVTRLKEILSIQPDAQLVAYVSGQNRVAV
jgi:hypothetical protein